MKRLSPCLSCSWMEYTVFGEKIVRRCSNLRLVLVTLADECNMADMRGNLSIQTMEKMAWTIEPNHKLAGFVEKRRVEFKPPPFKKEDKDEIPIQEK